MMQQVFHRRDFTTPECLIVALKHKISENPTSIAVIDGKNEMTWQQMYDRAARISRQFGKAGIIPGQRLALDGSRSVELYLMVVACLLSGISFISVPGNMSKKQKFQFADKTGCAGFCSPSCEFEAAGNTDAGKWRISLMPGAPRPEYRDEVYCVRTSGTTGEPKLVPIGVPQINAFLKNAHHEICVAHGLNWAWIHDLSFDFSIWELFGALSFGGCLVVVSEHIKRDPGKTRQLLEKAHVHVLSVTPSEFRYLFGAQPPSYFHQLSLNMIVFCGEKLTAETLRSFFPVLNERRVQLLNTYGPSEATVFCSSWRISESDFTYDVIPIGKPFPGVHFSLKDCKEEGSGNLVLEGAQVFTGYEGREPLRSGYLTGDICRCDNEGVWHYIGRNEGYYKINGFRVDPLEVEEFLQSVSGVCEAVVWLEEAETLPSLLKACVNVMPNREITTRELRIACSGLSPWLRPARYLIVSQSEWPINSRGKTDRSEIKRKFYGV